MSSLSLSVPEPPHFSSDRTDITTSLGNTVVLQCTPPYSDSQLFWLKDKSVLILTPATRNMIQASSGNLYIISVSASDSGHYECVTFNPTLITLSSTHLNITGNSLLMTHCFYNVVYYLSFVF